VCLSGVFVGRPRGTGWRCRLCESLQCCTRAEHSRLATRSRENLAFSYPLDTSFPSKCLDESSRHSTFPTALDHSRSRLAHSCASLILCTGSRLGHVRLEATRWPVLPPSQVRIQQTPPKTLENAILEETQILQVRNGKRGCFSFSWCSCLTRTDRPFP
jgi:hypothetical protein